MVVKKDNRREPFDRSKIVAGLKRACEKRPVSMETIKQSPTGSRPRSSNGASPRCRAVYRRDGDGRAAPDRSGRIRPLRVGLSTFKDIDEFMRELEDLIRRRRRAPRFRPPVKRKAAARHRFGRDSGPPLHARGARAGRARLGLTTPNPSVGCVIVRGGQSSAAASPASAGVPTARRCHRPGGRLARGATAYVSFEPCAHLGQTPPCAHALVDGKGQRVVDWRRRSGRACADADSQSSVRENSGNDRGARRRSAPSE